MCIDISRRIYIFCYIPCNSIYYSISFHVIPLCDSMPHSILHMNQKNYVPRGAEDPKQLKNPPGQSLQHHCPHQPVAIPIIGGVLYLLCLVWGEKTHQCPMPLFNYMAINGQFMGVTMCYWVANMTQTREIPSCF